MLDILINCGTGLVILSGAVCIILLGFYLIFAVCEKLNKRGKQYKKSIKNYW